MQITKVNQLVVLTVFQVSLSILGPLAFRGFGFVCLFYEGPGKTQKDVAAVRADKPIPVTCGLYYYEVKITCRENEG